MSIDDLLRRGLPEDYETVEQLILSGQVDDARVADLLRRYTAFAAWWRERAAKRQP